MIELEHISYSYELRSALCDVSLFIEKGESVSLLGANGSGKSTLLKLLNGLIFADHGVYRFDKVEIKKKKLENEVFAKTLHQRIGFVFQNVDAQLFCADVYDEIAFGPRQMGLDEAETERRVQDMIELFALAGLEHRNPCHLSGGEKRKVAIACVLSLNPEILMLDEPLTGLDPRSARWLTEFLAELNGAGKTILVSTHDLGLVQEVSRRSILFGEDHRIASDTHTSVLLDDVELLKRVNLVDRYYHKHSDARHSHFHIHNY